MTQSKVLYLQSSVRIDYTFAMQYDSQARFQDLVLIRRVGTPSGEAAFERAQL